jgi:hypothetical protein
LKLQTKFNEIMDPDESEKGVIKGYNEFFHRYEKTYNSDFNAYEDEKTKKIMQLTKLSGQNGSQPLTKRSKT